MGKVFIAVAVIVTLAAVNVYHAEDRESAGGPRPTPALLEDQLIELGEQYDFYFTVETAWQEKEHMNWMENYRVRQFSKDEGIHRELERLTETVPYFTYTYDNANPKVIHIKDARLAQQPGYPLEDVIKNVNYEGSWMGLVNALAELETKVSVTGLIWIGDQRARDYSTQIHVKAQNITARDAITNFIELTGRRRILWLSTTKLGSGEWSYLQLYGAVKKP